MLFHWSFDPVLVHLGPLAIRWYGLLFVGAFFFGQFIMARIFREEGLPVAELDTLLFNVLIGTIVGARLTHCFAYDPAYYLAHPLEIIEVWKGGLASHGGAVGMLLVLWWYARHAQPRLSFLWLLDRVAIPATLGGVFIRVANFLNSEIIGVPTAGNWGVVFDAVDALPRHPVQLYEALAYLIIFAILGATYWRKRRQTPQGMLVGWYMVMVFGARFFLEFFKTAQASYDEGLAISVGQYLSLPFMLAGVVLVVRAITSNGPPQMR
ncbi:prolipoprotein diacylglyceryl transferase [Uliginosibacterium gangwonense]|uniref:prolipoprotein diacylglyceryl transferase n=1 Tax=Uliginosibacterium gangwonense TaxID=392736 RepID=UPI00036B577A|nr:prolipoprotein diacylglyceryl transferase [Uliginosibacterium gangwonense]